MAGWPVGDTEGVGVGSAVPVGVAVGAAVGISVTSGVLVGATGKEGRYRAFPAYTALDCMQLAC